MASLPPSILSVCNSIVAIGRDWIDDVIYDWDEAMSCDSGIYREERGGTMLNALNRIHIKNSPPETKY
jgi:hypothetical protein